MKLDAAQFSPLSLTPQFAPGGAALQSSVNAKALRVEPVDPADPFVAQLWQELLAASESAEKIYQSPAYVQFLAKTCTADRVAVLGVFQGNDVRPFGLLPLCLIDLTLDAGFQLPQRLRPSLKAIRLLGSVPLLPDEPAVVQAAMRALFARYPQVDTVSMQAVPAGSAWRPALEQFAAGERGASLYVLNGWRDCHTIPLPESFALYLKQFSAKKRYNLTRQVKQLHQAAGSVQLVPITTRADVSVLFAAAARLNGGAAKAYLLSERSYLALADEALMLSYVIDSDTGPCGIVLGSISNGVWHVHNILWDARYAAMSIGTSVLHMSIEHALEQRQLKAIDLGYGAPNRDFNSSHTLRQRGHVLLLRGSLRNSVIIATQRFRTLAIEPLRAAAKRLRKRAAAGLRRTPDAR
jgi:hypothetical protein